MKKIAVCIPSYNESNNITETTKKIDKGLIYYLRHDYEVIIINIDNNSPDNTSQFFKNTPTTSRKESIITYEPGKGTNLLYFFKYCKENNIDYAVTIDADVKSLKPKWIHDFLNPLIEEKYDYVTPIYKRSRYEGSTTNHFAFPIVYGVTGMSIRQPIAGDFAFNRKFINLINQYPTIEATKRYGIDIFMTLIAAVNKLKTKQILLESKIHNPSFNKMEKMFPEVLDSFLFTWQTLKKEGYSINNKELMDYSNSCIIKKRLFGHKKEALSIYQKYSKRVNCLDIEQAWLEALKEIAFKPETIVSRKKEEIISLFMIRATKFWFKSEKISALNCEKEIINQAKKLRDNIKKEI